MTELSIRPDDIAAALREHVESFRPSVTREEVGRVTETGAGIARVGGRPSTMALELLEFPGGLLGMALNLDVREIGCVVFGDASGIEEGAEGRETGRVPSGPGGAGPATPAGSCGARWAAASWAGWSTPSAAPWTATATSRPRPPGPWSCRPRRSSSASRGRSRW